MIEDSVLAQLRAAIQDEQSCEKLRISNGERQTFLDGEPTKLVRALVKQIGYSGDSGAVALQLGVS